MSDGSGESYTTAQAMIDLLVEGWGVRHIFGIPGDGINGLISALRNRRNDVQFIQMRHEEAAAFAAVGYAKFSGRLGVCIATTGPGAVHLLNGLYDARMDGVPVLALTGLPYHDLIGQEYQQDVAVDRLMMDVAGYNERVMGPAHADSVVNRAVRYALSRRSVAHVTIPSDFQEVPVADAKYSSMDQPHHTSTAFSTPLVVPQAQDLQAAADILNQGERVAILVGAGAREARSEVEQVADLLGAPIIKALLGKDVIPDDHPHVTGGIGPIGTSPTHDATEGCDTFLMIGTSFPYVAYLPKTDGSVRGVQIDLNPERVGLRFPVEVGLVGSSRETLRALIPRLQRKQDRTFLTHVQEGIRRWKDVTAQRAQRTDVPMKPQVIARELSRNLTNDAILAGDSGTSALWTSRDIELRADQRFSVSGLMASMACGLPYAIGAQVAFPHRQVVAFVGDGALAMLPGDLATLAKYNLPVKVVVLKNNALGFIRWEQLMYAGEPEYGVELQDIDFVKVAEGFGLRGFSIQRPDDAAGTVRDAFALDVPVLIEAVVDPYEPLLPASIKAEQAEKMASALGRGESNAARVAGEVYQYAVEKVPYHPELLIDALQESASSIVSDPGGANRTAAGEPAATMEEQRATALERQSGPRQ